MNTLYDAQQYVARHSLLIRWTGGNRISENLIEEAVSYLNYGPNWYSRTPNTEAMSMSKIMLAATLKAHLKEQTDHYGLVFMPLLHILIPIVVRHVVNWWCAELKLQKLREKKDE